MPHERDQLLNYPLPLVDRLWRRTSFGGPAFNQLRESNDASVGLQGRSTGRGKRMYGVKWFAACQPLQLQAGLLDHTANASGKQKVTSLVQLQTPSFRDLGGSLEAPLLHLQNIEGALGWYKP